MERLSNEPGKTSQPWFVGVLCVEGCGGFEDDSLSELCGHRSRKPQGRNPSVLGGDGRIERASLAAAANAKEAQAANHTDSGKADRAWLWHGQRDRDGHAAEGCGVGVEGR